MQLPTYYQSFIHTSRYSRWIDKDKRRETWEETVDRYMTEVVGELVDVTTYYKIRNAILNMEIMPSMRSMMTAGEALHRDNTCGYNCSYLPVDSLRSFDEAMFILLCGTGVGFSVERQFVSNLPAVPDELVKTDDVFKVQDSKEGWAGSLRTLFEYLFAGVIPDWDTSLVRPAGARLKTFGGRASGPEPLIELFNFVVKVVAGAKGRKLSSMECHDIMCKIGEVVVVGGVRRSAMISLSNLSDDRLRHAKSGNWWEQNPHRRLSNNSVSYTEKPDMETFMREWLALVESKSGERGIFNRQAAKKQAAKNGRRDNAFEFGTNPCCVTGDTLILTSEGYRPISETVGQSTQIWNGEDWATVEPYAAGVSNLLRVNLSDGSYLDCTPNHRWCVGGKFVETDDLMAGMKLDKFDMPVVGVYDLSGNDKSAYSQGFYSGDGTKGYTRSWVYEPKYGCIDDLIGKVYVDSINTYRKVWNHGPMLDKEYVPLEQDFGYKMSWFAGLLDSDGTVTRDANGSGFQIASVDHTFLNDVRLMLTTLGVRAKVVSANVAGVRSMPDGRGGYKDYLCKETKRLLIGNYDAWRLMELGLGKLLRRLNHDGRKPQRDARQFVRVVSVDDLNYFDMTYCFTEPKTSRGTFNGIVTGNSEIILRPYQFCNLTEVVVRASDTKESLIEKVKLATILGTVQSTYTYFPYLRDIWRENTEAERLLGVSLTGILDNTLTNGKQGNPSDLLLSMKEAAVAVNKEHAERLGIPQSAAITCVKPSGTVSQLVDSASGIHPRWSDYYIRTVRGDNKDPLTKFLKSVGVPNEPDVMQPKATTVFSFPQAAPVGSVTRNDMTALEHLELWLTYQRFWCEHKPSITVNVKDSEWLKVGAWVYEHFDEVSGISFLPHSDHTYQQAPYQEVDQGEYEELLKKMPDSINWTDLAIFERSDNTKSSQTFACSGDSCEWVDIN